MITSFSKHAPTIFLTVTHMVPVFIVTWLHETIKHYPVLVQAAFVIIYIAVTLFIYNLVKRYAEPDQADQIEKLKRYQYLHSHCLAVVSEFLKDRYKASHKLNKEIKEQLESENISLSSFTILLRDFDSLRREQIKSALQNISSFLPRDSFRKPKDADDFHKDIMKFSFYAVEYDTQTEEEYLVRKWRYYPNEGEPQTPKFKRTDGAAGIAWNTKRIVVCENGGEDPRFKDMWDGGGQKAEYASLICVPAIKDVPADKVSDVYGVLTVDSPVRKGYFQNHLEQFWADLFQPICNILIYCQESENKQDLLIKAVSKICPDESNE